MHYILEASRYVRGMLVVGDGEGSPTSPTAKLCEAFSGNRYSHREHGFLMDSMTFRYFSRAAHLGCKSADGVMVEWTSPCGSRFQTFDPRHPARALRSIARDGR